MGDAIFRQTVGEIIDERPLSPFQFRIIALCALVVVLDGFDTQCIGFLVPYISDSLNVPLSAFGPVLAAGLFGLMLGAMASGLIADRWGRRWTVIGSTLTFAMFAIATARATSLSQLVGFRFLTGLGLGGALPNAIALASEYAPQRTLGTFVSMVSGGMAVGALVAGLTSSVMIPHWGWRSVLYFGGAIPIGVTVTLIGALPESVRFLMIRMQDPRRISKIMGQISSELAEVSVWNGLTAQPVQADIPTIGHLFADGRGVQTLVLWILFFTSLLTLYFIVSWLPALLREVGMPAATGVTALSLFSAAGVAGAMLEGPLMSRGGAGRILLVQFLLSAALIASIAGGADSRLWIMATALGLGWCVNGAQAGLNALAASVYPTVMRSTGVGWALGIGRIGSIVGPLLAGVLLVRGWTPAQIFLIGAVPTLCGAATLVASSVGRRKSQEPPAFKTPE